MKNIKLEVGDGITWGEIYPDKSKEIHQLLEDNGYKMYRMTTNRNFALEYTFCWDGQYWLTCVESSITNPLSYEQIKAKILGITEPSYEIY